MRPISVLLGIFVVITAYFWAMQILMVRGAAPSWLARLVFRSVHNAMYAIGLAMRSQKRRQQIWALYIPVSLLGIIAISVAEILVGYTLIFYGVSSDDLRTSYINSVSSLSVLGFGGLPGVPVQSTIALIEAFTGPIFVALLIANLATMYSWLNQEKTRLRAIDVQVGRARSGPDLILRAARGPGLTAMSSVWMAWSAEFEMIKETIDTTEAYLMVASPSMHTRWVSDVEAVLDAANLRNTVLDLPPEPQASRCLSEGAPALGTMVEHFRPALFARTRRPSPRTVSRDQFDEVYTELEVADLPVVPDQDAAWQRFADLRKSYEASLAGLSHLMHAPTSDWP